jgi:hypothetical protein
MYIATLIVQDNADKAHQSFISHHRWIAEHGNPEGFAYPTWWQALVLPSKCQVSPLRNGWITFHSGPDQPAYSFRQVTYQMDVFEIQERPSGAWLRVTKDGSLWVMAHDCSELPGV